jgi:cobalt-zinc-cadmium efflux system protein
MGHHHHDHKQRAFALGVVFNVGFVIAEGVFGVWSGSLALLADAGHNLSDVLGLLLAWGANLLGRRSPTRRRTYGWRSTTIMAALFNALILLVVVGGIAWEAILRFYRPAEVAGFTVVMVALGGFVVNTATALLFMRGRKHDLNIRGAFLHMTADAGVSAGVAAAGVLIMLTGWRWLDPVVSLIIAAMILLSTWGLLRESLDMALHAVPAGIDTQKIEHYLAGLPGIDAVHDLHVWAMSTTQTALTAHLVKPDPSRDDAMIARIQNELHDRFGIEHITIQWERTDCSAFCSSVACAIGRPCRSQ